MSACVQRLDHRLELLHLLPGAAERGVAVVRREEADGVVAPVVGQAPSRRARGRCTNWCTGMSSTAVTPSEVRCSMTAGCASPAYVPRSSSGTAGCCIVRPAHVRLVDHRLVVLVLRRPVVAPVEERVDDDGRHGVRGRVVVVALVRGVELVRVERRVAVDLPVDRLGVRVEQQLVRVAPVTARRVVRAVHAVAVPLARA